MTLVEEADFHRNAEIEAAYMTKYHRYADSNVSSALTPQAREATLRLVPSD